MKFRTTWILLILTVAGVGYFLLVERPRDNKQRQTGLQEGRLVHATADAVDTLIVERPDVVLEFHRDGKTWRMKRPVIDRIDDASVSTLLLTVLHAEIEQTIPTDGTSLSEFGLSQPAAIITLKGQQISFSVRVGDFNMSKDYAYAAVVGSDDVLLLPAGIRRYSLRDVFEFRNKKVADFAVDDVDAFELATNAGHQLWTRTGETQWNTTVAGDTISGDRQALEAILKNLRGLRADAIPTDSLKEHADFINESENYIRLHRAAPLDAVVIQFSNNQNGVCYAKVQGETRIVEIDSSFLRMLSQSISDLRDRTVLHVDRRAIMKVTWVTPDATTSIMKSGNEWAFANPGFGRINQSLASTLLARLETVKFSDILRETITNEPGFGLNKPSYRLTVTGENDTLIDELVIGGAVPKRPHHYATSLSSDLLGTVDKAVVDDLESQFQGLRGR